jgi:Fuc2NAc and GlcNAc transferase
MTALLLTAVAVFAASWAGSGIMMRWLSRRMILDHPVERSSHVHPVPKGSGVAVTTALLASWVALTVAGRVPPETLLICCLGFALAASSWLYEVTRLPDVLRLALLLLSVPVGFLLIAWTASTASPPSRPAPSASASLSSRR